MRAGRRQLIMSAGTQRSVTLMVLELPLYHRRAQILQATVSSLIIVFMHLISTTAARLLITMPVICFWEGCLVSVW